MSQQKRDPLNPTLSMVPEADIRIPPTCEKPTALATMDIDRISFPAPTQINLPSFSHVPPVTVRGRDRWPASLEAQAFPSDTVPVLLDVLIWVNLFLEPNEQRCTTCLAKPYSLGPQFGPLWFTCPWSPNRR